MARRKNFGCIGFLILTLAGCLCGGLGFFFMLKPELEVKNTFVETTCSVLDSQLVEKRSNKGNRLWRPDIKIRYEVDGKTYTENTYRIVQSSSSSRSGNQNVVDRFKVGQTYPCWYDPGDPARVVLDRSFSMMSLLFTGIGALLAFIGSIGFMFGVLRGGLALGLLALKR